MNNKIKKKLMLPVSLSEVAAGFPSPADDFLEDALDLNDYLVRNPTASFMVRVSGSSMNGAGILPGDILVVDRSLEADHGRIVIAAVDGELTVKRLLRTAQGWVLSAENPVYRDICVTGNSELSVWGVVSAVVRRLPV